MTLPPWPPAPPVPPNAARNAEADGQGAAAVAAAAADRLRDDAGSGDRRRAVRAGRDIPAVDDGDDAAVRTVAAAAAEGENPAGLAAVAAAAADRLGKNTRRFRAAGLQDAGVRH